MLTCDEVCAKIRAYPFVSQFLTEEFVREDYSSGRRHPIVNHVAEDPTEELWTNLSNLDSYLGSLASCPGFAKLSPGLRANNEARFDSAFAAVKTLAWLEGFGLLREIEPPLPSSDGQAAFVIDVGGTIVYGEIWEPVVPPGQWTIKGGAMAYQDTESPTRLRKLRGKGDSPLPSGVVGMWVIHTGLRRVSPDRARQDMAALPNVLGAALWSSPGSTALAGQGLKLKGLAGDAHAINWVENQRSQNKQEHDQLLRLLRA